MEIKPLEHLEEFKEHRRLRVFYHKGCECVKCGRKATQIVLGDGRGQLHWDLYDDDFYPLTIDHIHPKSLGGSDELDNLQPMCYGCNQKKGNGLPGGGVYSCLGVTCKWPRKGFINAKPEIGKQVWLKKSKKFVCVGTVIEIVTNPHTNKLAFVTSGKRYSMYDYNRAFIPMKNNL